MLGPLIETSAFTPNPQADWLHSAGLQAELDGAYETAHQQFAEGLNVLARVDPRTVDTVVQSIRIRRDDGFASVREAADSPPIQAYAILYPGQTVLARSAEMTAALLGELPVTEASDVSVEGLSRAARRELLAEHGATISLLGRTATVRRVLFGSDHQPEFKPLNTRNQNDWYGLAHDFLKDGSNGYYRVSNAMAGARAERRTGNIPQMALWLSRAIIGLGWTAVHDRRNLRGSVLTFGNRIRHLPTRETASDSVLAAP